MCKGPGVGRSCQFKKLDEGQNRGEKVPGADVGHVRQVRGGGCEGLVCFLRTGGGFGMVFKRDWWGRTAKGTGGAVSRLRRSEGTLSRPGCHGQTVAHAAHCTGAPRHMAGFVRGAASSLCPAGEAGLGLPGGRVIFFYFPRTLPLGSGGTAPPVVISGARRMAHGEVLTPVVGAEQRGGAG